ncbi:MAG TPA: macrolide ABC transporter ATP-binding protein [Lachnospiraceae bacterium]|nr:macrolide ABC transporter ATP-binding protein [Lachnospiraceae bacterium]
METAIQAEGINKVFTVGTKKFYALADVSVSIPKQALTIFKGRSGSGKTTLLNILGALDIPSSGEIVFQGEKLSAKTKEELELMRRRRMGFVFQSAVMIPCMNAYENVEFSLRLSDYSGDRDKRVREILGRVGLLKRMEHMADELSGGERQRVAIARALAHHPEIIFADEPTGALDTAAGLAVAELFKELVEKEGAAIVMTTHDPNLMEFGDMVYEIADGRAKRVSL